MHVLHITTAQEMEFLAEHKDVASVEATPQHLTLDAPDCYERLGTLRADQSAGARRLASRGHLARARAGRGRRARLRPCAAHPGRKGASLSEEPIRNDRRANAGSDHARSRQRRPAVAARFVDLTSAGPARLFGIARKGRIAAGYDADLTVVDLKRRETITNGWIASRAGWTPYDGVTVTGWPVGTFVRGRKVMWEGESRCASTGRACTIFGDVSELGLFGGGRLLPRLFKRKFALADPAAQTIGEGGCRFFAIGGDKFSERGEQTGLRQAIAVNAVEARLGPGFPEVTKCQALLFAIGNQLACVNRTFGRCHCFPRPRRPRTDTHFKLQFER